MTRTMQDSVNAHALTPGADFYAGYVDGARSQNIAAVRARCATFPRNRVVSITVLGGHTVADIADVETGDLTPQSGAAWALWRHQAGAHPTLYCDTSRRPAVETECRKLGLVLHRDYEVWEAHYPTTPPVNPTTLPAGAVAWQYRDHGLHGENIDMSIVADNWPGVDPPPAARPIPAWFTRSLDVTRPYEHGPDVHRVQHWLINHGFLPAGSDDGVYGPNTGRAVAKAKAAHHLRADTHVGSAFARIIG